MTTLLTRRIGIQRCYSILSKLFVHLTIMIIKQLWAARDESSITSFLHLSVV